MQRSITATRSVARPRFVSTPPQEALCAVCNLCMVDPVSTICAKRGCSTCIKSWLRDARSAQCPFNHKGDETPPSDLPCKNGLSLSDVSDDHVMRNTLLNANVYCYNEPYGCKYQPTWRKLEDHLKACKYVPVNCINKNSGCNEVYAAGDVKHIGNCGYTTIKCMMCQQQYLRRDDLVHLESCLGGSKKCHKCQKQFTTKQLLESHQSLTHFQRDGLCHYSRYGCQAKLTTEDEFTRHHAEDMKHHIELLTLNLLDPHLASQGNSDQRLQEKLEAKYKAKIRILQLCFASNHQLMQELTDSLEQKVSDWRLDSRNTMDFLTLKDRCDEVQKSIDKQPDTALIEVYANQCFEMQRIINELDRKLQEKIIAINLKKYPNGILTWKITEYHVKKEQADQNPFLLSPKFYTGVPGYQLRAKIFLNGEGPAKGKYVSLYLVLMPGEFDDLLMWPLQHKITFGILCPGDESQNRFRKVVIPPEELGVPDPNSMGSGIIDWITIDEVESTYLDTIDDTLYVQIKVEDTSTNQTN